MMWPICSFTRLKLGFKSFDYYRVPFSAFAQKLKNEKTQTQGNLSKNSRIFTRETQETGKFGANFEQKLKF